MKTTGGAIDAKNAAIKRIRDNIERIYDDFIIDEKIYTLRINFCIKDDLYTKNKEAVSEIKDIEELINFLDEKRLEQIREDDKNATPGEHIAKLNSLIENYEKERAKEEGMVWPTQEIFRLENGEYVKDGVKSIMRGTASFFLFKRININPDLWRSVIAARVLRVPMEKVLEYEELILTRYFLPTVDNDHLIIRINELTKIGDLDLIFDLVEIRQKNYAAKYGYIDSTTEYPSRKADRIITNCHRKGFNLDEIHRELESAGITKKYDKDGIKERIREYERQTRQTFKPADKMKFACL